MLEYKNKITYLEHDYNEILKQNYGFLDNIRKIRNKYEHKMHNIKRKSSSSGSTTYFDFEFNVYSSKIKGFENISIEAKDFIILFKKLNILFSKMVKDIIDYSHKAEKEHDPYYRRLRRFGFEDFNKIYDSSLLQIIGKLMLDY